MDLEYTYILMLGTVDILDDDYGTDTTATNSDTDLVFMSFKIACLYCVCMYVYVCMYVCILFLGE